MKRFGPDRDVAHTAHIQVIKIGLVSMIFISQMVSGQPYNLSIIVNCDCKQFSSQLDSKVIVYDRSTFLKVARYKVNFIGST